MSSLSATAPGHARKAGSRQAGRAAEHARAVARFLASDTALLLAALAGLAAGAALALVGRTGVGHWVWAGTTLVVLVPTTVSVVRSLLRRQTGVDIIALLAMVGALLLGEYLAGTIIAVMLTGGGALERYAVARARRELGALLERAPREAHRVDGDDIVTVEVAEVEVGDRLLIKPGEVVPADGILRDSSAVLDESALTGESRPAEVDAGAPVRSGSTNAGSPFEIQVTAPVADSTYAGIIRLVREAEESKAPFVRLADRYALGFLGLTLAMAGLAWALSADPIRALAVLVVATPCPLILAAPAAIIAGVSRAARQGVIIKGGGPLETIARTRVLLLDKTGTVTSGRPKVAAVESFGDRSADEVVQLAASVEQVSLHPFAAVVVAEARARDLDLTGPTEAEEAMGTGIAATVGDVRVAIGQLDWVAPDEPRSEQVRSVELRTAIEGSSSVYVTVDGELAGALILSDPVRAEAPRALRELRKAGIDRIDMVTGDHPDVAALVGDAVGIDRVFADRAPEDKVDVVGRLRSKGVTTMVGDGINDAPALARADVGIAMGARGATAASEAADVVLTADRLEGLLVAVRVARRTRHIALESVLVGMGLSGLAMVFAALGFITPVAGAVLQEGIDVLVILNALRALGGGRVVPRPPSGSRALGRELAREHRSLRPRIDGLADLAARLDTLPPEQARTELEQVRAMLDEELLPHEREEQRTAFVVISDMLEDEDPTAPLIQTHHEIQRLARLYARLVAQVPEDGPDQAELRDLRRALYGLHAILTLHFDQEDELYSMLEA